MPSRLWQWLVRRVTQPWCPPPPTGLVQHHDETVRVIGEGMIGYQPYGVIREGTGACSEHRWIQATSLPDASETPPKEVFVCSRCGEARKQSAVRWCGGYQPISEPDQRSEPPHEGSAVQPLTPCPHCDHAP